MVWLIYQMVTEKLCFVPSKTLFTYHGFDDVDGWGLDASWDGIVSRSLVPSSAV